MSKRAAQIQARILREGLSKYPRNVHTELLADGMGTVNGVLGEMVRRMDRDEAAQFLATFQRLVKKVGDADNPVVAAFVGSLLAELAER